MAISVKNLNFFYGSSQALFDINLDAQEGDTVVLLGPSGAGKSTLIRTLNLLEVPTSGELHIANNHFDLSQAGNNNPKKPFVNFVKMLAWYFSNTIFGRI